MPADPTWHPGETLVLTASTRKWGIILAACVLFVGVAVTSLVSGSNSWVAWLAIAVFAPCALVAGQQLRAPSQLQITPTHIDVHHVRRRTVRDLASCSEFEVWRNPSSNQRMVVFDHPDDDARPLADAARTMTGRSGALPGTFGMSAAELAELLNRARSAALAG